MDLIPSTSGLVGLPECRGKTELRVSSWRRRAKSPRMPMIWQLCKRSYCRSAWPLRPRSILPAQRQEILRALNRLGDFAQKFLQVFVTVDESDVGGVDDQQIGRGVVEKEVLVGFDHFFEIFVAHGAFAGDIFFLQALLQHVGRGLKINHQVGGGQLLAKVVVVAIVGVEFLGVEMRAGEEFVFLKDEVGDHGLLRSRPQMGGAKLLEAPHKKSELGLEGRAAIAFIKRIKERIRLGLDDALRIQALAQDARQRTLADSDGTFHSNVAGEFEKIRHGFLGSLRALTGAMFPELAGYLGCGSGGNCGMS